MCTTHNAHGEEFAFKWIVQMPGTAEAIFAKVNGKCLVKTSVPHIILLRISSEPISALYVCYNLSMSGLSSCSVGGPAYIGPPSDFGVFFADPIYHDVAWSWEV